MSKTVDLSHLVFMDLLGNLVEIAGTKVAKGNLMRIAMNTGAHVEKVDYAAFDDFVDAVDAGETPLTQLEGNATHISGGIFGLKKCPFGALLQSYNAFFTEGPQHFEKLTQEFNSESKITQELRVGFGAGTGAFCIFHQPMRSKAGENVTIAGKPIEIYQLACKSADGKKAIATSLIDEFGADQQEVENVMNDYMCCYGVRMK